MLLRVLLVMLAAPFGCGLVVSDVPCRADSDCGADTLCISGTCVEPVDRPPPDAGPPPPGDAGVPDAGPPTPEVSLLATPDEVSFGETVTLSWTANFGDCTLDGAPVERTGSLVLDQPVPFRHVLTCVDGEIERTDTEGVEVDCQDPLEELEPPLTPLITQADVEAYVAGATGCFRVAGDFNLIGTELEDLSALYGLAEVQNDFNLSDNPELISLRGLGLLGSVGGGFAIAGNIGNDRLLSLQGLNALETVGGNFQVNDHLRLRTLEGLDSLTSVLDLRVQTNRDLVSLDGIESLREIQDLLIQTNDSLADISAISDIETYPDTAFIQIRNNPLLPSLAPLSWITSVGFMEIENLESIEDLDGLQNLTSVPQLDVIGNDALTDVSALNALTGEMSCLRIESNEALARIEGLNDINMLPGQGCGEITFNNNAPGLVVEGLASLTTVGRLEIGTGLGSITLPALQTASEIFIDNTRLTDTDIFPALQTVDRLRFDDADLVTNLVLPQSGIQSLFIQNNNLLETINVNGATATCWTQTNNPLLQQTEIDRVSGVLGVVQVTCP